VKITQFRRRTLYSAIEGREAEFRHWLEKQILRALVKLGDDIRKLEWCNSSVSMESRIHRDPALEGELKKAA
jgi:hypothetical protein